MTIDFPNVESLYLDNKQIYSLYDVTTGHILWMKATGMSLTYNITDDHKDAYIYRLYVSDTSKDIYVNWGDGTVEKINLVDGQNYTEPLLHTYSESGIYNVTISNNSIYEANIANSIIKDTETDRRYAQVITDINSIGDSISVLDDGCFGGVNISSIDFSQTNLVQIGQLTSGKQITAKSNGAFAATNFSLESLSASNIQIIGNSAFREAGLNTDNLILPSSLTAIGSWAFYYSDISSVVIPNSVVTYGFGIFRNSDHLEYVKLPDNMTEIPDQFLVGTSKLLSIELPATLTKIGKYAFGNGKNEEVYYAALEYVKCNCTIDSIPSKDDMINIVDHTAKHSKTYIIFDCYDGTALYSKLNDRFYTDSDKLSVVLSNGAIYSYRMNVPSDNRTIFTTLQYRNSDGSENVIKPFSEDTEVSDINNIQSVIDETSSITEIGNYSFMNCISLSGIYLCGLTTIGNSAFRNCTSLSSFDLQNTSTIGDHAFRGCSNLSSVCNGNMTTIGSFGFYNCESLLSIDVISTQVINRQTFDGCSNLTDISGNGITQVGYCGLYQCRKLSSIAFQDHVTKNIFGNEILFTVLSGDVQVASYCGPTISDNLYFKNASRMMGARQPGQTILYYQYDFPINSKYIYMPTINRIKGFSSNDPTKIETSTQRTFQSGTNLIYLGIPNVDIIDVELGFHNRNKYTNLSIDFSERTSNTVPSVNGGFFDGLSNPRHKIIVPTRLFGKWCIADNWTNYAGTIGFTNSNISSISDEKERLFNDIISTEISCTFTDGSWKYNSEEVSSIYGTFEYVDGYTPAEGDETSLTYTRNLIYNI